MFIVQHCLSPVNQKSTKPLVESKFWLASRRFFLIGVLISIYLTSVAAHAHQDTTFPVRVIPYTDTETGLYWHAPHGLRTSFSFQENFLYQYQVFRNGELLIETNSDNFYDLTEPEREYHYRIAVVHNGVELASSDKVASTLIYDVAPKPGTANVQRQFLLNDSYPCMLDFYGYVRCRGLRYEDQLNNWFDDQFLGPYTKVDARWGSTCGIKPDGTLECVDFNLQNTAVSSHPFTQISLGWLTACAIDSVGSLFCWGDNQHGLLDVPSEVGPVMTVSTLRDATCAVEVTGMLRCWGDRWNEVDYRSIFPADELYADVAVSEYEICALKTSGDFICINREKEISISGTGIETLEVSRFGGSGEAYVCGLDFSGFPHCWSEEDPGNEFYQVPDNTGGYSRITVGSEQACVQSDDGRYKCWNSNGTFRSVYPDTPLLERTEQYGPRTFELFWSENLQNGTARGNSKVSGYEIYRNGEFHKYRTGNNIFEDDLSVATSYTYEIYPITSKRLTSHTPLIIEIATSGAPGYSSIEPVVLGDTISWENDGWYQVQTADEFKSVCEGGLSCSVDPGIYIVTNHWTGDVWGNIEVRH